MIETGRCDVRKPPVSSDVLRKPPPSHEFLRLMNVGAACSGLGSTPWKTAGKLGTWIGPCQVICRWPEGKKICLGNHQSRECQTEPSPQRGGALTPTRACAGHTSLPRVFVSISQSPRELHKGRTAQAEPESQDWDEQLGENCEQPSAPPPGWRCTCRGDRRAGRRATGRFRGCNEPKLFRCQVGRNG